jgi:hypothetical protein
LKIYPKNLESDLSTNRKFSDAEFSEIETALQPFSKLGRTWNQLGVIISTKIQPIIIIGGESCAACHRLFY